MKDLARYTLLSDLDEALVAECLPPSWGGVVSAAVIAEAAAAEAEATATTRAAAGFVIDEPVAPRGFRRVLSFLRSGWGIGLIASAVAVGVAVAALAGGWHRPQEPVVSESHAPDSRYESEPEDTEEPEKTGGYDTTDSADPGEMILPEGAKIAVYNGREQMILPEIYPLWTTVWMPGQDGQPGSMATGDSFGMPAMEEMLETLTDMTIRWDAGLTFVTAEGYRVTAMRLYDSTGEFMYSVAEDEVAVLDGRAGSGVYYVQLGLLETGKYIEEAHDHEERFYEVPFRLLIGDVERETLSSYPSETSPPFFDGQPIPYQNTMIHPGDDAFGYGIDCGRVDTHLVIIDSLDAYMALEPKEPMYDAKFFQKHLLVFICHWDPFERENMVGFDLAELVVRDNRISPLLTMQEQPMGAERMDLTYVTAEIERPYWQYVPAGGVRIMKIQ